MFRFTKGFITTWIPDDLKAKSHQWRQASKAIGFESKLHDARRTAGSNIAALMESAEAADRVLNHALPGATDSNLHQIREDAPIKLHFTREEAYIPKVIMIRIRIYGIYGMIVRS